MNRSERATVALIVLCLGFVVWQTVGSADSEGATTVLLDTGYTDLQITGHRLLGCPSDMRHHTGFTATGITGRHVTGVVCSGSLTGTAVVRLDEEMR